jgi:hypothetical protein
LITTWFLQVVAGIWRWLMGLAPASAADPVAAITPTVQDIITPFASGIADLGVWIPWDNLTIALGVTAGFWGVSFFLRLARAVLGHLPIIGGNG